MSRTVDAQSFGPLLVFGAFAASDAALRLLEVYPGSALAWYFNFDVFHTFGTARLKDSPLAPMFGPYGLLLDGGLIAAVILARALGTKWIVAFLANLAFAALLALMHCRLCEPSGHGGLARALFWEQREAEIALGAVLLAVSFMSFALSHSSFVAAIVRENGERRRARVDRIPPFDAQLAGAMC